MCCATIPSLWIAGKYDGSACPFANLIGAAGREGIAGIIANLRVADDGYF